MKELEKSFTKGGKYGHDHYVGYSGNKRLGALRRPFYRRKEGYGQGVGEYGTLGLVLCDPLSVDRRLPCLPRHAGEVQEDQAAIRFIVLFI